MASYKDAVEGVDQTFPNYLVIDGVPVVARERETKLRNVLTKLITQVGSVTNIEFPFDEATGKTMGICFVECSSPDDADKIVKTLHGHPLDGDHTFKINKWSDFAEFDSLSETYVPPTFDDSSITQANLQEWLLDPLGNDQFATLTDNVTEIMLNSVEGEKPTTLIRRSDWTDKWVTWSSRGSFFATLHFLGIVLWGGPGFEKLRRLEHRDVDWLEFSPCEKYLVTYSSKANEKEAFVIWDIMSGDKLKTFPRASGKSNKGFSPFQWSHDDKYCARLKDGVVAVYEAPAFHLLEKSSFSLNNDITAFKWSPKDSTMACYVPEVSNSPAKVVLMAVPSRRELAQKILYGVTDCKMYWHPSGDYLAVEVNITQAKGKKAYTSFELFLIREKGIPIDSLKIEDSCIGFEWEPRGKRFGVIHTEDSSATRYSVSFYSMEPTMVKHISTLEKRQANEIHWSPAGRFVVLAGIRNPNGIFEFYDVDSKETLANDLHHPMTTDTAWDPTGRYFVTYVSFWKEKVENGYSIWSITGQKLYSEAKSKFCQFIWRPRPPTLLTKEVEANIEKNIKSISETYKKEDEVKKRQLEADKKAQKTKLRTEFEKWASAKHAEWVAQTDKRRAIRNGYVSDDEDIWHEVEIVEELIVQEKREVLAD